MIDKFDKQILRILQKNNMTPQRDIGEEIGLSAAAVQRRIKRMRESGIILSDVSILDRSQVGNPITLIVEVSLHTDSIASIDKAKADFTGAQEVQQCYYVTGEADFVLVILVESMQDYEGLTRRIFYNNENIKHFKTTVTMNIIKAGLEIPVKD